MVSVFSVDHSTLQDLWLLFYKAKRDHPLGPLSQGQMPSGPTGPGEGNIPHLEAQSLQILPTFPLSRTQVVKLGEEWGWQASTARSTSYKIFDAHCIRGAVFCVHIWPPHMVYQRLRLGIWFSSSDFQSALATSFNFF